MRYFARPVQKVRPWAELYRKQEPELGEVGPARLGRVCRSTGAEVNQPQSGRIDRKRTIPIGVVFFDCEVI